MSNKQSAVKMPDAREFANRLSLVLNDEQVEMLVGDYAEFGRETLLAAAAELKHAGKHSLAEETSDYYAGTNDHCARCKLERVAEQVGK